MNPATDVAIVRDAPLATMTSLGLGGPAQYFASVTNIAQLRQALRFAQDGQLPLTLLAGGSNLVVADEGVSGLVLGLALRGIEWSTNGDMVHVRAAAGEALDSVVEHSVARGLWGLECLSGIPGSVGATPIQNVGAYGREVSDIVVSVEVLDLLSGAVEVWPAERCELAYRDSLFRREPGRFVVLAVTFELSPDAGPTLAYAELAKAVGNMNLRELQPSDVRRLVLGLRKSKSMLLDPSDENGRSVGSFFKNPVVTEVQCDLLTSGALAAGVLRSADELPRYPAGTGQVKLAAGFLVERSGFVPGKRRGKVGISSRHALCLVHHGGGRTADLLALAAEIQQGVQSRFSVQLVPEPVFAGFDTPPLVGAVLATFHRGMDATEGL